ncbi:MAG TPA: CHASE3 domain-containing protein, partial [Rhodopila sp.]|nr:CHASE3 domain-containing protein [Rhodopila sp.]
MPRNPVRNAGLMLLAISVAALLLGFLSYHRIVQLRAARATLRQTYAVIAATGDLGIAIRDAERGQRGFLLTGKDTYLPPYYQGVDQVARLQDTLLRLTADDPEQQAQLQALTPVLQRKLDELAHTVELSRNTGPWSAEPLVETDIGLRLMAEIEERLDAIEAEEKRRRAPQLVAARDADDAVVRAAVGGAGVLAVCISLSAWFLFRTQQVHQRHQAQALLLQAVRAQAEAATHDSEAKLRELVGTLDLASVFVRGMDGTIRFWSKGCEHLYGWTAEEAVGRHYGDLLTVEFLVPFPDIEAALLRDGAWKGDLSHRRRDGTVMIVAVHKVLRRDADGHPAVVMESVADVTVLRAAQAALEGLNKDLEARVAAEVAAREAAQVRAAQAERMHALGQLAGGIAHDLNNVLQAVQGSAGLIERSAHSVATVQRLSRLVLRAADRGAAVTSRLLAFSRQSDLRPTALNAATLLGDLRELLLPTLGAGLDIRIETPTELPLLLADKSQLETVLVNLATNGRDAMAGTGVLTLQASAEVVTSERQLGRSGTLKAGAYVRVSIVDTGHGMDAATLARVTEPFFTTKPDGKGTGLGLAMAQGFAEQSGGLLHIESVAGHGTVVSLWLPAATHGLPAMVPPHDAQPVVAMPPATLLVVDDDEIVRDVLATSLEDAGYTVLRAAAGQDALALLNAGNTIDLLLSDYSMPGMNGLTLIREAQRDVPGLPAILLTGY